MLIRSGRRQRPIPASSKSLVRAVPASQTNALVEPAHMSYDRPGYDLLLQRGLTQGVSHENGAEQGLERPYGKPDGFLESLMGNHMVQRDRAKSEGVLGVVQPPRATPNGSPPQYHVSPRALAACLPGTNFLITGTPPAVTSG